MPIYETIYGNTCRYYDGDDFAFDIDMQEEIPIDADKFVLEQVYRPYQSMLGFNERLTKQPYDNKKTIELLKENSDWSNCVLDRINRCKFEFSQWIKHPVIDFIKYRNLGATPCD